MSKRLQVLLDEREFTEIRRAARLRGRGRRLIFIDSNIPMYLVGAAHVNKTEARRMLEGCVHREERLVTDAEVLQEILDRYAAIGRRDAIQPAFDAVLGVGDDVYPVEREDVERARAVLLGSDRLSARAALHIAAMERCGITSILTFDAGFEGISGLRRVT